MIIHFTSEVTPYYKRGGLGDVAGVLPFHLSGGQPNVVISFYYEGRMQEEMDEKGVLHILIQGVRYRFVYYHHRRMGVEFYFLNMADKELMSDLEAGIGSSDDNGDKAYKPDACMYLYFYFAKAALQLIDVLGLSPEIGIFHDWQVCGCFAFGHKLTKRRGGRQMRTVLLIHNYEYQGELMPDMLPLLDTEVREELEAIFRQFGKATLLSLGLRHADAVATVSDGYAQELKSGIAPHSGLDFISGMDKPVYALPNGIDEASWSPANSAFVGSRYGVADFDKGKRSAKRGLAEELGFSMDGRPLVLMLCRLTEQKGINLLMDFWGAEEAAMCQIETLLDTGVRLIVCGHSSGGKGSVVDGMLRLAASRFGDRFLHLGRYSDRWAHRLLAAADMLLCPSLFEPCGLVHLYGMQFGTVPIVRPVGGLGDTVIDYMDNPTEGTGFYIRGFSRNGLIEGVNDALGIYRRPGEWKVIVDRCMRQDFSWSTRKQAYFELFDTIKGTPILKNP